MIADPLFELIIKILVVFGVGVAPGIEIWVAIPLGVIMGLSPPVAALAAVTGTVLSVGTLVAALPRLKSWFIRKFLLKQVAETMGELIDQHRFLLWDRYGIIVTVNVGVAADRKKRLYYLWDRYGVPIAALGSPLLPGTHQVAALCIILGAPTPRVLFWTISSTIVWSIVLALISQTAIYYLGLDPANFENIQSLLELLQSRP